MLSEEQKLQIKMSMNDKWQLVKLTHVWPDGHLINQMAHALIERNAELLSLREQLAEELKASIGFNVGDRVCDSVDKLGYGYVVSINNGKVAYPISVQFDKSDKGRIATYTADGRKLSGCPVCLYKTPSVTAAKPSVGLDVEDITEFMRKAFWRGFESARGTGNSNIPEHWKDSKPNLLLALKAKISGD